MRADARIDPNGEDLPADRFMEVTENVIEVRAMQEESHCRSRRLQEKLELQDIEAIDLADAEEVSTKALTEMESGTAQGIDLSIEDMLGAGPKLETDITGDNEFIKSIQDGYASDPLFRLVKDEPDNYKQFELVDGMIWTMT